MNARTSRPLSPLGELLRRPRRREMPAEERQQIIDDLFIDPDARGAYLLRFFVLMVLSSVIAALGLIANSVAVIIGAMLIAPLMTPILAVGAALVLGDLRGMLNSLVILAGGVLTSVATAALVTRLGLEYITISSSLPSEIVSRTEPSLLDLGVAVAAGLAAGFVTTHRSLVSSLPGVAIAVALVPPLATVGITAALDDPDSARGALLLFATNLVAIVLSAILMMRAAGLAPVRARAQRGRAAHVGLVVSTLLLVAVAIPLTLHTVETIEDRSLAESVRENVGRLDPVAAIIKLRADARSDDRAVVTLELATTSLDPIPAWELAQAVASDTGRIVELDMRTSQGIRDAATAG